MKKLLLLLLALTTLASCNRPEPENEGVLMTDYGRNGLSSFKTVTGAQGVLGPGTELYEVPMYEQTGDPDLVKILSNNTGEFTIDPLYVYQAIRGKGPEIIFRYKQHNPHNSDFLDNVEKVSLDKIVIDTYREVARTYSTDSLMSHLQQYEDQVEARIKEEFLAVNFQLNRVTSGLTPPKELITSINATNDAIQQGKRLDNELENAKKEQEIAKVKAETDKIASKGLTEEILTLRFIEALEKNGFVYITDGNTPIMMQKK